MKPEDSTDEVLLVMLDPDGDPEWQAMHRALAKAIVVGATDLPLETRFDVLGLVVTELEGRAMPADDSDADRLRTIAVERGWLPSGAEGAR
jgi:hypothetical protein